MARNLPILALLFAAAVQLTPLRSPVGPATLTDEQLTFVAWGEARFTAAGLDLPEVSYEFHNDTQPCRWHRGLYLPEARVVVICNMNEDTLVHELAHAWVESNLSRSDKAAFLARRGLPTWSSHGYRWDLRGTEHAAEIIAWGLAPESELVKWVDYERERVTFRLLTIPDSQPHQLLAEYRLLAGSEPIFRHPGEWTVSTSRPPFSPETARAPAESRDR